MEKARAGVIVDSRRRIEFLSGEKSKAAAEVARIIRSGDLHLAGPILFEVLIGPRTEGQRRYLQGRLRASPLVPTTEEVWFRAIELGRLEGVAARKVPFSDVLIAAHADVHGCELFSTDPHFDAFPDLSRHRI
jgi:predicted nucleic acid-binding protein